MNTFKRSEAIDSKIEQQIIKTLQKIEHDYDVRILHAVESGSRAWGFHSPNSDYDVRFIYVHKRDWYLNLYPGRDVIELPINQTYDITGWDLKKTLHLAIKSNAVVMEWLQSPIVYKTNDFGKELKSLCTEVFDEKPLIYHYLNLGIRQIDQTWRTSETTQIKKYFYMLRPAMALRWINNHKGVHSVPMNIQVLMAESDVSEDIRSCVNDLIAKKKTCIEKAEIRRIHILDTFICSEYEKAQEYVSNLQGTKKKNIHIANMFFQNWLY